MPARSRPQPRPPPFPIVDAHVHINPWHLLNPSAHGLLRSTQPNFDEIDGYLRDPAKFVARMDAEHVEQAWLINYVAPEVMGFTPKVNDWAHEYVKDHRDRLVPFGGFHPDAVKDPRKEIERILYTLELRGVKIHGPHMLVAPNDYERGRRGLKLLYEACEREKVPIMFHTGTSIFPLAKIRYGDPLLVDEVAVDFPKLKIVLAHAGRPFWTDIARFLARRHKNVYFDISSIPPRKLLEYLPRLEEQADKGIYGSDWPGPVVTSMRGNADEIRTLGLGAETLENLLRKNAAKVVGNR